MIVNSKESGALYYNNSPFIESIINPTIPYNPLTLVASN